MNTKANDNEKRLDAYIDALNAGRPAPPEADDIELADLFATARDLRSLRAAEPARDDVPSRLAAALERELRANPTHGTRRIESNDMSQFRAASSNRSLRPPDDTRTSYEIPRRPERVRQWAQFLVAAVAFVLIGVVLAQIIGGGTGDDPENVGGVPTSETPTPEQQTPEVNMLAATVTVSPASPTSSLAPSPQSTSTVQPNSTVPVEPQQSPSAEPTAELAPSVETESQFPPDYATLSLTHDYVTCESEVIARGMGFTPRTTVVIYGGPLFGDNFGPVADDIPVAENGGFESVIDVGRVFSQCQGVEIDQEGASYVLGAETGSSLTKQDFEGPSALTVITFSSTAPDTVRNRPRLPSCGTEVIRTETEFAPAGERDVQARECFVDAVNRGAPVEFVSHFQTEAGILETLIYHSVGNAEIEVIVDGTRDPSGAGGWGATTCVGPSIDTESGDIDFEACRISSYLNEE